MKRIFNAIVVPAAIAMALPFGASASALSAVIDDYVTEFDMPAIDESDRKDITAVHKRDDLAHGMKVLMIHDILLKAGALEHANVHDITPEKFELSSAD